MQKENILIAGYSPAYGRKINYSVNEKKNRNRKKFLNEVEKKVD